MKTKPSKPSKLVRPTLPVGVTFGVTSTGNPHAILMSLSSVILQALPVARILIRMEGEYPGFGNFYMEQLAALARIKGIEFTVTTAESKGIRYARDWLIENCATRMLWMGDDDVVYAPDCLQNLVEAYYNLSDYEPDVSGKVAYINGNKPDVNNRRGYDDFKLVKVKGTSATDNCGYNYLFSRPGKTVKCHTCDTGNLLLDIESLRAHPKARFQVFKKAFNSSGDDTLFALMCHKEGLHGFFRTDADSYHLEKPGVRFNEFTARKNMLLRECELLGIDPAKLDSMLPWLI